MTAIILLVNKAALNAAKHVFRHGLGSLFKVSMFDQGNGRLRLVIHDDEPGIAPIANTNDREAGGLGIGIMQALSRQLGGSLELTSGPGTTFTLDFPMKAQ
jgi:two-component sensor histidine kinase